MLVLKRFLATLLVLILFFIVTKNYTYSYNNNEYFIVTAYYSPLPNQTYYLRWNYIDEKILNWEWIKWASWKWVFSWMLAAPKNYSFWTKIYLEWLGIWEVADRWWAIVNAWNRWYKSDRIDLWVWYWDEWLKRALYWGKRKVKWSIINSDSKVSIKYSKIPAPNWTTIWLKQISNIFNIWIGIKSDKESIIELQKFLKEINLYKWDINWKYTNSIIDIIYDFQLTNWLIKKETDYWAWYFWNKTRSLMLKMYLNWDFDIKKEEKKVNNIKKWIFEWPIQNSEQIIELAKILTELWLYKWVVNWNYANIKPIIIKYQIANKIISNKKEIWVWNFWPKTRKYLKNTYKKYIEENKRQKIFEEKVKKLEEISKLEAKKIVTTIWNPKLWEVSQNVRELQNALKKLWYFNYKDTAIFWKLTKESLINFQLKNNIISDKKGLWAWIFWPQTKWKLQELLSKHLTEQKIKSAKLLSKSKEKIENNKTDNVTIIYKWDAKF